MSLSLMPTGMKQEVSQKSVKELLDENCYLIRIITECQSSGRMKDAVSYQSVLHRFVKTFSIFYYLFTQLTKTE